MSAAIGPNGVTSISAPSQNAYVKRGTGGTFTEHRVHTCPHCDLEQMADVYVSPGWEGYSCEGCKTVVALFDDGDLPGDEDDIAHVDDDRLDGDPEHHPWHGREAS